MRNPLELSDAELCSVPGHRLFREPRYQFGGIIAAVGAATALLAGSGTALGVAGAIAGIAGGAIGAANAISGGAISKAILGGPPGSQTTSGPVTPNGLFYYGQFDTSPTGSAINDFEHQDISLPGNSYGSIPEGTSTFGQLNASTPAQAQVQKIAAANPITINQTAAANAAPVSSPVVTGPGAPVQTFTSSPSTWDYIGIGVAILGLGAVLIHRRKNKK